MKKNCTPEGLLNAKEKNPPKILKK